MKIAPTVVAVGLCVFTLGGVAQAANTESDLPVWLQERFEPVHYDLTRMVDNTARNIDQFFGTEDSLFVENQSFLRIALDTRLQPGDSKLDPSVRFRVDMPTTKKRLRLIIESDIEEPLGRLSEQGIREVRGGGLNDARFGHRMRGEGVYADTIHALFTRTARRLGFESTRLEGVGVPHAPSPFQRPAAPAPRPQGRDADDPQLRLF